ncbi:hypothetical protein BKA70DRAFT_171804 [Coprinopsis sp. MPI-PUGE-AT-0042]|nr:hypothetical protein BKA70DRAFT_171804 [Coprinopsis sp. MPI-PUGE-AT-0042]
MSRAREYNARLADVRFKISAVEAQVRSLKLEAQRLEVLQEQKRRDLKPLRRVPDDVLREIFMQSLPAEVTFNCLESPLLLTHICSHWRALAWDCSQLWTSLSITTRQSDPRVALRDGLLLDWFKRCKGSNVDFHFIFLKTSPAKERKIPGLAELYDTHFEFFPRALTHVPAFSFRSLTLYCLPLKVVLSFPRDALPSLERLVLTFHYSDQHYWVGDEEPIRAFENCRLLRRLALKGDCLRDLSRAISFPWHQLTHFFFDEEPWRNVFWECVSPMAALEHAYFSLGDGTLGGLPISEFEHPNSKKIVLRRLSSLTISFWGAEEPTVLLPDFWRYFDFPNLQTLRLVGEEADLESWPDTPESFRSIFFDKLGSMKHVTRLSLCFSKLHYEDCATFFDFLPEVSHLDLEGSDSQHYRGVLAALEMDGERLPKLKTIVFEVGNESAFSTLRDEGESEDEIIDVDALRSMVWSRRTCKPEKRLERVVFYGSEGWQVTDFKPFNTVLKEFVVSGLIVENKVEKKARKDKVDDYWVERDEYLDDWREAGEIFKYHAEI